MDWGGIIGAALAGGASGALQSNVDDIVLKQKEDAIAMREERLQNLRDASVGKNEAARLQAKSDSEFKNRDQNAATMQADELAKATGRNLAPASEETKAQNEANRLHKKTLEDQGAERIQISKDNAKALETERVNREAERAAARTEVTRKDAEKAQTRKDEIAAKLTPKFVTSKEDPNIQLEATTGDQKIFIPGTPEKKAVAGFLGTGLGSKDKVAEVTGKTVYRDADGKDITVEEVIKHLKAVHGIGAGSPSDKVATPAPADAAPAAASASGPPAGYTYFGTAPDGRSVYKNAAGDMLAK